MKSPLKRNTRAGFSLIEMIVVVGIIALIASFAVPAASTVIRGSQLTQASQVLSDQISLARQQAITKNRSVEVRFYRFGDNEQPGEDPTNPKSGKFRAIQLFEVLETGTAIPMGKISRLPSSVVINDGKLTTLIDGEGKSSQAPKLPTPTDPELPRGVKKNYEFVSFRFLPDGSTNLVPTENWYATLHDLTSRIEGDTPPANFFTIQVDPVSGTTKKYRPSAG
jgi:uncharacterized protein (TIGR02596 family)